MTSTSTSPSSQSAAPTNVRKASLRVLLLVLAALAGWMTTSCNNRESRTIGVYTLAITDKTAPALQVGDSSLWQVTIPVQLPLAERPKDLGKRLPGYPGTYWISSTDLQLQLSYVITNLENEPVTVEVMVDGWNEFIRYTPTVTITEEGISADRGTVDRLIIVPAKSRVSGRVSYDDFERVARAMAILLNDKIPNPAHILEPSTNLSKSPLAAPYLPATINGLTGFDLSMRLMEPKRVALEATLEIIDSNQYLIGLDEKTKWRAPRRWSPPPPPRDP